MITRIITNALFKSHAMVTAIALGLVLATVSVEQGGVPWASMVRSWLLHGLLTLVWLGPLLCGVSTALTLTRMEHRGEIAALACMGLGRDRLRVAVLSAGAVVGLLTFLISAMILPEFTGPVTHGWVWTSQGLWHTGAQSLIDLEAGGQLITLEMGAIELQRAEPRLASWTALRWSGGLGEQVELIARPSRVLACIGFAALGLRASAWARPWIAVVGIGAVLLVTELMGWTLAAQGQTPVYVGGTVSLWVWGVAAWPQPSIRSRRPV